MRLIIIILCAKNFDATVVSGYAIEGSGGRESAWSSGERRGGFHMLGGEDG